MTVRANDLALLDLGQHSFKWDGAVRKLADVDPLIPEVVELQNDWVGLAAVDAWMIQQIREEGSVIGLPHAIGSLLDPGACSFRILCMSELCLGDVALPAPVLAPVTLSPVTVERR